MTQAMLETECSIESDAATAVAQETTIAATTDLGQALEIAAAAKPVAVPVSRAIGGTRKRRRSDQRWQVTEADLNMYGLIVGRAPTEAERIAALTPVPNEATALRDAGAGRGGLGGLLSRWHERAQNGAARASGDSGAACGGEEQIGAAAPDFYFSALAFARSGVRLGSGLEVASALSTHASSAPTLYGPPAPGDSHRTTVYSSDLVCPPGCGNCTTNWLPFSIGSVWISPIPPADKSFSRTCTGWPRIPCLQGMRNSDPSRRMRAA